MSIFLVYSNTSEYESTNELIGYTTIEDSAKQSVTSLKESYLKAREFNDNVINPSLEEFAKNTPSPKYPKHIEHPRWPSGISQNDITQEMRDERQEVFEQNSKNTEAYNILYREWKDKEKEFMKQFISPVENEPWFQKWFDTDGDYIRCRAYGLVEGHEYIYERCEEIKP
jgi:hypothetical protein